ncbi:MAG: hypothetical protein FJ264_00885 [Planctomycetes bacterium]|nr:hypothetical protein [Planctomycetota bacterium]
MVIRLWCTLIFACMALWAYADAGFGMESDISELYEWDSGEYSKTVFTINGHPLLPNTATHRIQENIKTGNDQVLSSCNNTICMQGNGKDTSIIRESYSKLPLYFIKNEGQMGEEVKFYETGSGHVMYFTEEGVYLSLIGGRQDTGNKMPEARGENQDAGVSDSAFHNSDIVTIRLIPIGANKHPEIVAEGLQEGTINYFIGNEPENWRTNIPTYSAVVYKEIYKGIDLKFYGNNRQLEYDVIVRPGADPAQVRFAYEGIEDLRINKDGDLEIILGRLGEAERTQQAGLYGLNRLNGCDGSASPDPSYAASLDNSNSSSGLTTEQKIIQKRPYVYQEIEGKRVEVKGRFVLHDADSPAGSGLQPNGINLSYLLQKSPLKKGEKGGCSHQITRNLMTLGLQSEPMNVLNPGAYTVEKVLDDINDGVQVVNLNPQRSPPQDPLQRGTNTYPSAVDTSHCTPLKCAILYSPLANVLHCSPLAGVQGVEKTDVCPGFPEKHETNPDAGRILPAVFVGSELDDKPSQIVNRKFIYAFHVAPYDTASTLIIDPTLYYSTYIGSSSSDYGNGIAVDSSGAAYITGRTTSTGFPLVGTNTPYGGGSEDAFVIKLGTSGASIVYSTYIGGTQTDRGYGIAVDSSGSAYITGDTSDGSFPRVGTTTAYGGGSSDAFVTKLGTSGASIEYSTLIGGTQTDRGYGIAVDSAGYAYITGQTQSRINDNFPIIGTTTAYGGGTFDVFVTKLGTSGASIAYSTYIGGSGNDSGAGIAVDGSGSAYITGFTQSGNFPRVGTTTASSGGVEAFVAKLGTDTSNLQIVYSTYLGGSQDENGNAIAVDGSGSAYVTGFTYSNNFPVVGTTTGKNNGTSDPDVFVTKLGTDTSPLKFIYSTYIGGSAFDQGYGIAVDSAGSAYITGEARSIDFPIVGTTTGKSDTGTSTADVYFARLGTETPITIVYSTYIGGANAYDIGRGIAVDGSGYAYITGETASTNFPRVGTSTAYGGGSYDVFVTKLDSTPSSNSSSGGGGGGEPVKEKLTVNSTSPSSGATGVSENTEVSATFNMYVNGSTVTKESFKLSYEGGDVEGSVVSNGATITFTPSLSLLYGTKYTAKVTTKVQAANWAGTTMESDYSWNFTTETAPIVSSPTPAATESPVPEVSLTPTATAIATITTTVTPQPSPASSPTPVPTPTGLQSVLALSKEVAYLSGDTVIVTVADGDRNTDAQADEILTTAIKITGDNYYIGNDLLLDLNEDSVDSGTFMATIKTGTTATGGADGGNRSNIGTVKTMEGGTVTVAYSPYSSASITKKLSFSSSDATLAFGSPVYRTGEYAEITLNNAESNEDNKETETILEKVSVQTSQFNIAVVKMLETGTDTGIFRGSIMISTDSTLDYERIQAAGGDILTASYYDETTTAGYPQLVTGECMVAALPVPTVAITPTTPVPLPSSTPSATEPVPSLTPTPTARVCGDAENITVSPDTLELEKDEKGQVTVTVTDADGCGIEGIMVKRKVTTYNSKKIKIEPSNRKTDADGKAVFTIKVKKDKCNLKTDCNAKASFKANEVVNKAEVTVWMMK